MIHSKQFKQVLCAIAFATLTVSSHSPVLAQPADMPTHKVGPIEVRPIEDALGEAKTVRSALKMVLNGQLNRTKNLIKGSLTINLMADAAQKRSSFTISGDLLSVVAGVGAGAFAPNRKFKEMGFYVVGDKSYFYMDTGEKLCTSSNAEAGTLNLMAEAFKPESLLNAMGTSASTAFSGELVGEEKINGVQTLHYKLDAATMELMNAKSQNLSRLKGKITKGNIWVAVDGKYLVRLLQEGNGTISKMFQQQDYIGRFGVQYDILAVNKTVNVKLPTSCNKPLKSFGADNPFNLSP